MHLVANGSCNCGLQVLRVLVDAGADMTVKKTDDGTNALFAAAFNGHASVSLLAPDWPLAGPMFVHICLYNAFVSIGSNLWYGATVRLTNG